MPANAKTIFKKATEELRKGFEVVEDKDYKFRIKYGDDSEIEIVLNEHEGKYYNTIWLTQFRKSGRVRGGSCININNGSYRKDKEMMEQIVGAIIDNVYFGCDINNLEAFLNKIKRNQQQQ